MCHLSSPNLQKRWQQVLLHLPRHICWASQWLGNLCSQQHDQLLTPWYPPMPVKLRALVVTEVKEIFGSKYRMSPVWVMFTGCSAQHGWCRNLWHSRYLSGPRWPVPKPSLPPILPKLSPELSMALSVTLPHCWNGQICWENELSRQRKIVD